ncbi:TPA: PTS sugar transporter subunit IIC, partial [Enterococcus faecium]|nr:PTS sugar transporter subunit IIC [Enterococcus faecium]
IATAFAILSNANAEAALTIAIPISVLGQILGILMRTILSNLTHVADRFIEQGKFSQARRIHILYGSGLYALMYFIPIFLAIYFGTNLVSQIVDAIPEWLTNGLTVASKILPAYGFALLLQTMLTKKMVPFLLLGFLITAYSGLGIIGIAAFACIVAFVMVQVQGKNSNGNQNEPDPLDDL